MKKHSDRPMAFFPSAAHTTDLEPYRGMSKDQLREEIKKLEDDLFDRTLVNGVVTHAKINHEKNALRLDLEQLLLGNAPKAKVTPKLDLEPFKAMTDAELHETLKKLENELFDRTLVGGIIHGGRLNHEKNDLRKALEKLLEERTQSHVTRKP